MARDYEIDGYLCAANATIDQVHPRVDIILARRIPEEEITASGLIVPEMARNKASGVRVGEVLKCGPGDTKGYYEYNPLNGLPIGGAIGPIQHHPMECKPGDRILYMRCPDNDVNIGGVGCVFLREEQHVLAILDKPVREPVDLDSWDCAICGSDAYHYDKDSAKFYCIGCKPS